MCYKKVGHYLIISVFFDFFSVTSLKLNLLPQYMVTQRKEESSSDCIEIILKNVSY